MIRRTRAPFLSATAVTLLTCGFLQAQDKQPEKGPATDQSNGPATAKTVPADTNAKPTRFLQLKRNDEKQPVALQTAVTRFTKGKGDKQITVDLVSAVHVGDREYYAALNKLFNDYDVVLYELVAPKGVRPVRGQQRGGNPVSFLQNSMKTMLNLDSQTELVNYRRKNFVHADMTPSQIAKRMEQRGDSGLSVALDVMADMVREMNRLEQSGQLAQQPNELDLMTLLFDENSDQKLKLMMAEQFVATGSLANGLGDTLNRMLVTDRNEVALKVLRKEIERGHKKIAIFYGAAHMPDFEKRLTEKEGMKLQKNTWLTAWDLTKQREKQRRSEPDPFKILLRLLEDPPQ